MDMALMQTSLLRLAAGAAIGCLHFGGLWLTVNRTCASEGGWTFLLGSFVLRSLVTIAAIWLASGGRWEGVIACVLGVLLVRRLFIARIRPAGAPVKKETLHELHGH